MAKLNRRQILLSGAAGLAATSLPRVVSAQTVTDNPTAASPETTEDLFEYDGDVETGGENRVNPSLVKLTQPQLPYDRTLSKLMILCTQLAVEQYEESQKNPQYDGSIRSLPSYTSQLDEYQQIASFNSTQDIANLFGDVGALLARLRERSGRRIKVFIGFGLTSPQANIMAFRGTMNIAEWLGNMRTRQSDYVLSGVQRGRVHRGFLNLYERIDNQIQTAISQFNPKLPTHFTGHSLGGALATLAAADTAFNNTQLRSQMQLYTYGSPRVGDPSFAEFYSSLVPNSYRIVNLCDAVLMVPPSSVKNLHYRHVGQRWSFVYQSGDMAPNHSIALYTAAINRGIETDRLNDVAL